MRTTLETKPTLNGYHLQRLKKIAQKITDLEVPFSVFDEQMDCLVFSGPEKFRAKLEYYRRCVSQETEHPIKTGDYSELIACPIHLDSNALTAIIDLTDIPQRDEKFRFFAEILELVAQNLETEFKCEQQLEMMSTELAHTYEELVLLHRLGTNMKVTEPDSNFLQMACDSLTEIVNVEGIAIMLEKNIDERKQFALLAGSGIIDIDSDLADCIHGRLESELSSSKEALLDSDIESPFKYNWPHGIRNLIVAPLYGKEDSCSHLPGGCIIGFMIAVNIVDKPDFDSTDIKLFNSVANGCAVFIENGRLFKDLKGLFVGSLKALTNSIDAKDKYTRGHSERVAFISRWIAERVAEKESLDEENINKIYLAGLLHDIGKVGIGESVLRKEGKLTDAEYDHIMTHPSIGASILSGIKQMKEIVPGVLCHHERVDGRGYPGRLSGNQIPLIGRIVCLADCFDAMTSKRTYRNAMSIEHALKEIRKGLGTQFDENIGQVFLDSDIDRLWDIIQNGFDEIYGNNNITEYGTQAVGTLIR